MNARASIVSFAVCAVAGLVSPLLGGCSSPKIAPEREARSVMVADEARATNEMGVAAPSVPETLDAVAIARAPFVSIDALCTMQMAAVAPRLREAERALADRTGGIKLTPSCAENRAAMKKVKLSMRAPFYDATAISFEDGYGVETDLVVRMADGWVRVPGAIVYEGHDDPGCPSIVRGIGAAELRVEQGTGAQADRSILVVTTESDRGWEQEKAFGALVYSEVSACAERDGKLACGDRKVIAAREEMFDSDTRKALPVTQVFKTTYTIDDRNRVHPAKSFDRGP